MSKYENCMNGCSSAHLFFLGILAAFALLGLFFIVPLLLVGSLLVTILVVIIAAIIVLFAVAIILKGLTRLFSARR